jgi:hypothetical protein
MTDVQPRFGAPVRREDAGRLAAFVSGLNAAANALAPSPENRELAAAGRAALGAEPDP